MYKIFLERIRQGHRTAPYPKKPPTLPDRLRGLPTIDSTRCKPGCDVCAKACPTDAITLTGGAPTVDLGRCLFCTDCTEACPTGAIAFGQEYRLAQNTRSALQTQAGPPRFAQVLDGERLRIFRRSLKLRQVSAGGCNACEADINVLGTLAFDLGRFGIQVVASPRHADGLIITGPVSENMRVGLLKTYEALPEPRVVIVVGACAISGGPFMNRRETHNGVEGLIPVDLYIPGCPPHPYTILDGLLRLLGRLPG